MPSLSAAVHRLSGETRGALGMVVALLLLAAMDSIAKALSDTLPTAQIVWARYTGQTVIVLALCAPRLAAIAATTNLRLQLLRSALLFGVTVLYFAALGRMPLAEAAALLQTAPLMITLMAAVLLHERVGPRRWAGVAVGLVGALILLRPGSGVVQAAALLPLAGAVCYAGFQVATRWLGAADGVWTTMLYSTGFGAALTTLALPFVWVTPDAGAAALLLAIGAVGCAGQLCLVWALSQAQASVLAPFNYAGLAWATLIGVAVFGEVPDGASLLGIAIITGAGLYVWHRERVRA